MKAGFAIVVMLALGALAANYLLQNNGYVLINFGGYIIEMSVPVLIFLLTGLYLGVRILVRIWRAPRQLGAAVARRRLRKAGERITQGYIELGQGNYARGERLLTRGARNSETPLLNYLAAARAAQAQGDSTRRDGWLDMAVAKEPRAIATVLLTRAQLQLDSGDQTAARASLDEALEHSPDNAEALRIMAEICMEQQDWQSMEDLLPRMRKQGNLPPVLLDDWTQKVWTALLEATGSDGVRAKILWKALPKHLCQEPGPVAARARSLVAAGDAVKAEALVRTVLKQRWDDQLILIYGELEEPDVTVLLRRVEKWLHERPEDPVLLLTAARLCVKNELWGKARSYYESSAGIRSAPETWHELGQLMIHMGDHEQAFTAFQKGLTQSYAGAELPRLGNATLND